MTRDEIVAAAKQAGWTVWGRLRRYDHSSYQCFRRGNDYAWIGLRYVERSGYGTAEDFVADGRLAVKMLKER